MSGEAKGSDGARTFRDLVAGPGPLVLPGAHDALSARLIEQAGFDALLIGGFGLVGARYGWPDIGLAGLGEIASGVQDILAATGLPALVDGDNGYGDVKNVVATVHRYEQMGAGAILLEDQTWPKRCGHIEGKSTISCGEMESKLRAAVGERRNPETFIIARTDARTALGLDEALRRAERYLTCGVDGVFVEALETVEEMERVGAAFDAPTVASVLEGGRTPALAPAELGEMGFAIVMYGITPLLYSIPPVQAVLARLAEGSIDFAGSASGFDEFKALMGFEGWTAVEGRYPVASEE